MRILLLCFSFIALLLCSCPDEEEERARERSADEENHGCRACPPISISADENCPRGFECDPDWKLTTNVLAGGECSCSEVKCADRTATLAVNGESVGKIRCKDHQWTNPRDASTTTSAFCAKGCGKRVCQSSHPKVSKDDYSPLEVEGPSDEENCASAQCPNGIAVFNDDGSPKDLLQEKSLVCSSSGKWKIGGREERYATCRKEAKCSYPTLTLDECNAKIVDLKIPANMCKAPIVGMNAIACPPGFCPTFLGKYFDEYTTVEWNAMEQKCQFSFQGNPPKDIDDVIDGVESPNPTLMCIDLKC